MNKKAIAMILVAALVAAAVAAVLLADDGECSIEYELNGGVQNPGNPDAYTPGQEVRLLDPSRDGYYFAGWYADEALTQPVYSIGSGQTGDLILYAAWSDNLVGKELVYSYSMDASGFVSYSVSGQVTYEYVYYDESRDSYYMTSESELVYDYGFFRESRTMSDAYWSGDSGYIWSYSGMQTISTVDGDLECEVWICNHSNGSTETQWIVDGWKTYRIEYRSSGISPTVSVYELVSSRTVPSENEVTVTAYGDLGISVSGSGTYAPGSSVTLVAEASDGHSFAGWTDSSGNLISTDATLTLDRITGDVTVYASNGIDYDVSTMSGESFVLDPGTSLDYADWTVSDSAGDVVLSGQGTTLEGVLDQPGVYTVSVIGDLGAGSVSLRFTLLVDGYEERTYEWSYSGTDYTYTQSILYSDVLYYRDYYDVSERQQDIDGDHARDVTFVTYQDRYVQEIASYISDVTSGMTQLERADVALAFSQCLGYVLDSESMGTEEYWKFPLETLYDHGGDCEDTSILFAAVAKAMGYDVSLFLMTGHMAAGISVDGATGSYCMLQDGSVYYYCETTATGYTVGEIPQSMVGSRVTVVKV